MHFRPLKKTDLASVLAVISEHYDRSYVSIARRDLSAVFTGRWLRPEYFVVEEKGVIIGCGGFAESCMDTGVAEIFWVNVEDKKQNQGIGSALIKRLIVRIKQKKFCAVLLTTTRPRFYQRLGFKKIKRLENGYTLLLLTLEGVSW